MADGAAARDLLNGNLGNIFNFLSAAAGLGATAMGLVDALKAFWGGPSNFGFGYIKRAVEPLLARAADAAPGLQSAALLQLLRSNWLNGVAMPVQIAKAKALIHLNLADGGAALLAAALGLNATMFVGATQRVAAGLPPTPDDTNVLGQFDTMVGTVLDAAYQRADQRYRNACKALAMLIATVLGVIGGWLVYDSSQPAAGWSYFGSWHFVLSLIVGLSSTPLAPIAKDLATSVEAAATAFRTTKV